jgi:hypothetical protein
MAFEWRSQYLCRGAHGNVAGPVAAIGPAVMHSPYDAPLHLYLQGIYRQGRRCCGLARCFCSKFSANRTAHDAHPRISIEPYPTSLDYHARIF